MKILITQTTPPYTDQHLAQIKQTDPNVHITLIDTQDSDYTNQLLSSDIAIISNPPTEIHQDIANSQLKWIQLTSAGVGDIAKNLLDTPIHITNASGVHPINIAEHVFGFMLMLARQIHLAHRNQITKQSWIKQDLHPTELHSQTIGIVGLGQIGKRIAHLAKAFDMQVLATTRTHNTAPDQLVDQYIDQANLDTLLSQSDYIINCLPYTQATHHYFTQKQFDIMKPTAYFINIGRGATVDQDALIHSLQNNIIAGAGLDVTDPEPLPSDNPLWQLENVIITPHNSGNTPKYTDRVIDIFCQNLTAFKKDQPMPTLVDKQQGY